MTFRAGAVMRDETKTTLLEPFLVDAAGAARLLDVSVAHVYALRSTGRFGPEPVRLGRACRYRVDELRAWLDAGCPNRERWRAMRVRCENRADYT